MSEEGDIRRIRRPKGGADSEFQRKRASRPTVASPINGRGRNPNRPAGRSPAARGRSEGFSLVELLVATAITGMVLVSVCTLYAMARAQVKAARLTTVAAAVGEDILSELTEFPRPQVHRFLDTASTATSATWSSDQADPAYATTGAIAAAQYLEMLESWRSAVEESLPAGQVLLIAEPFENRPSGGDPGTSTFASARFVRLELTVSWSDAGRVRRVTYDRLKF